jgi:RNA recognition motif-containing protein
MVIRVTNLPSELTQAELTNLLQEYGSIQNIKIFSTDGYAEVEIEGEANEDRAIQELNGVERFGQKLQLSKLPSSNSRDPKRNPPDSPGSSK